MYFSLFPSQCLVLDLSELIKELKKRKDPERNTGKMLLTIDGFDRTHEEIFYRKKLTLYFRFRHIRLSK